MFDREIVSALCDLIESAVSWSNVVRDSTGFVRMDHGLFCDRVDIGIVEDLIDFEIQITTIDESSVLIQDMFWYRSDFS